MSKLKKAFLRLAPLVVLTLLPVLLSAQDNMGMSGGKPAMSVTGCLKQGSDTGGYYLMSQDGKMYELMGSGLAAHVGHTITVTGHQVMLSHAAGSQERGNRENGGRQRFLRGYEGQ